MTELKTTGKTYASSKGRKKVLKTCVKTFCLRKKRFLEVFTHHLESKPSEKTQKNSPDMKKFNYKQFMCKEAFAAKASN